MERQQGFTYLGVLLAIALLGLGLTTTSEVWSTTTRRQRLEQLEWQGQQFVQAIGSYYASSPGRTNSYPQTLQDLLEDRRYPFTRRHLRQLYLNPFTGSPEWEAIRSPDGGILGVRADAPDASGAILTKREFRYVPSIGDSSKGR